MPSGVPSGVPSAAGPGDAGPRAPATPPASKSLAAAAGYAAPNALGPNSGAGL